MLRKALCAALAAIVFLTPVVEAKVLVVYRDFPTQAALAERQAQHFRAVRLVTQTLKTFGVDYTVVPVGLAKTEFIRTGTMVWNYGTAGAYTEQFDAVIHVGPWKGTVTGAPAGYGRADSALRISMTGSAATAGPTAPTLWVLDNATQLGGGNVFTAAACCTAGATGAQTNGPGPAVFQTGTTQSWLSTSYVAGYLISQTVTSGLRKHLVGSASAYGIRESQAHDHARLDSTGWASSDTTMMWEIPFSNSSTAKPTVFANFAGVGAPNDSAYDAGYIPDRPTAELDIPLLLCGLARLDSITGGRVFNSARLPRKIALTIDAALSRKQRRGAGGILPSDTTAYYAALDSIAALNVPVTFGVNIDSIATYARDIIKLKTIPKARFTPQNRAGLDTTAALGNASWQQPRDPLGRYRRRAAYGDGSGAGADTSVHALLRAGLFKCDSVFGRSRVSRFLLAPDDDYSPKNLTNGQASPGLDSLFWAIKRAGFRGVRTIVNHPDATPAYLRTNPLGFYRDQRIVSGYVGTSASVDSAKYSLKLVGQNGFSIIGGKRQGSVANDSTAAHSEGFYGNIYVDLARTWYGLTQDVDFNYDTFPQEMWAYGNFTSGGWIDVDIPSADLLYLPRRAYIKRFHASDFSGLPNGPPALNGWWTMKSIVTAARTINRLAGRTIVTFTYPEDVDLP